MTVDPELLRQTYADHLAALERAYAAALERTGYDLVVIHSGAQQKRAEADDQHWPLRPVPHFQQWLPLMRPDCALVMRPGRRPRLIWPRNDNFWEQHAPPESDHWRPFFDIVDVAASADVAGEVPGGRVAFLGEARSVPAWAADDTINPPQLVKLLDDLRVRKSPYEVLCIGEANRRAAAGHRRVAAAFHERDDAEFDLHLLYLAATRQDDPETPYKNIVALGHNAATLHHIAYRRNAQARPAQSLLIDAGASYLGYTSDITRTHVKGGGDAAATFGELVTRVEQMQQRLCSEVRAGLPYEDLHDRSHYYVAGILRDLGIVRLPAEQVVETNISRQFFPHGLGHSLGLQCHDVGCAEIKPRPGNEWLRNTTVIAPGQVFSIEPGIYFIDQLLDRLRAGAHAGAIDWRLVDELRAFGGVRIEDDVHVLPGDGALIENLTRAHLPE